MNASDMDKLYVIWRGGHGGLMTGKDLITLSAFIDDLSMGTSKMDEGDTIKAVSKADALAIIKAEG